VQASSPDMIICDTLKSRSTTRLEPVVLDLLRNKQFRPIAKDEKIGYLVEWNFISLSLAKFCDEFHLQTASTNQQSALIFTVHLTKRNKHKLNSRKKRKMRSKCQTPENYID